MNSLEGLARRFW